MERQLPPREGDIQVDTVVSETIIAEDGRPIDHTITVVQFKNGKIVGGHEKREPVVRDNLPAN